VVLKVCGVGLYSFSSPLGWKARDFAVSDVSLAFPFWVGSTSIFLLRREFPCMSASISSTLRFFKSANSCCILAWPSRIAAKSVVVLAGATGPASVCLLTPALLRVEPSSRECGLIRKVSLCAPRWAPLVPIENK